MRAAVIRMDGDRKVLRTEEVPLPACGDDQVLVRVSHAGICGSDLHGFLDATGGSRSVGLIMGHEAAGEVAAVGAEVTGHSVGDRVTVDPQVVCGVCGPCREGWISICDRKGVTGSSLRGFVQGAMAEYMVVHHRQVHHVPPQLDLATAAMIEPLANALHVVKRSDIRPGDIAVVLGAGPLGLCLVQCLRSAGAGTIVVTDVSPARLRLAKELGADAALNPETDDVRHEVLSLSGGSGADVVVESVGVDVTYQQAIQIVRKRGKVMFFGAVQPTVTVDLLPILHKELLLIGCTGANDETDEAIQLVAQGKIRLSPLITHQFSLEDADRAMRTLTDKAAEAVKVQVVP